MVAALVVLSVAAMAGSMVVVMAASTVARSVDWLAVELAETMAAHWAA